MTNIIYTYDDIALIHSNHPWWTQYENNNNNKKNIMTKSNKYNKFINQQHINMYNIFILCVFLILTYIYVKLYNN
jgi:hypothetical protein